MSPKLLLAALVLFLSSAVPARADNVQLVPGGAAFSDPATGLSMSPYTAVVNGQTTEVFCLDFSTPVADNASWTATATQLAGASSYAGTLQGNQTTYLEMAWLITQLQTALASNNIVAAAEDQWAIWSFTGGSDPYGTNASLVGQASTQVSGGFTVSGWEILTPDAGQKGQEFMVASPEPTTILYFLGSIMLVAVLAVFRKLPALS